MHIKPKLSQWPDMIGEFDLTDFVLGFDANGPVRHLNVHWDAVVHFCKTLDTAQDTAKKTIVEALQEISPDDADTSFMLDDELRSATIADETLTKATIFIVLCSFKEFALKELYGHVKAAQPLPPKRIFNHIRKTFTEMGFWPEGDTPREQLSESAYECVRNNFAHGDWAALKSALPKLDLHDEFLEVIGFLYAIRERMRLKRLNL